MYVVINGEAQHQAKSHVKLRGEGARGEVPGVFRLYGHL